MAWVTRGPECLQPGAQQQGGKLLLTPHHQLGPWKPLRSSQGICCRGPSHICPHCPFINTCLRPRDLCLLWQEGGSGEPGNGPGDAATGGKDQLTLSEETSKCPSLGSSRPCLVPAAGLATARCICAGGKNPPARVEDADADCIFRGPQCVYTHRTPEGDPGPRRVLCPLPLSDGGTEARHRARAKLVTARSQPAPPGVSFPRSTPGGKVQVTGEGCTQRRRAMTAGPQAPAASELGSCVGVRGFLAHSEGGCLSFSSSGTSREWASGQSGSPGSPKARQQRKRKKVIGRAQIRRGHARPSDLRRETSASSSECLQCGFHPPLPPPTPAPSPGDRGARPSTWASSPPGSGGPRRPGRTPRPGRWCTPSCGPRGRCCAAPG